MNKNLTINLFEGEGFTGIGDGALSNPGNDAANLFNKFLSGAIGIVTIVAFVWFVFLVISGALGIMFSAGDKNAVATGTKKITNGLIGIVIIVLAFVIIRIISYLLGFTNVPFLNPGNFIDTFWGE